MREQLFRARTLAYGFKDRTDATVAQALNMGEAEAENENAALETLERLAQLRVPQLNPKDAEFTPDDRGPRLVVTAFVPFTGWREVFNLTPEGVGVSPVTAVIGRDALQLEADFDKGTEAPVIKAHFAAEVEKIQKTLDAIAAAAEEFINGAADRAKAALDRRRKRDADRKRLEDGLSGGL